MDNHKLVKKLARKYNYKENVIKRWLSFYGSKKTIEIVQANEKNAIPSLRVNTRLIEEDMLLKRLKNYGFKLKKSQLIKENCYNIKKTPIHPSSTPEYLLGYFTTFSESSLVPVDIIGEHFKKLKDKHSQMYVLDMAAAPGVKSIYLAQKIYPNVIFAIERRWDRIKALYGNTARTKHNNILIFHGDARDIKDIDGIPKFHFILLDAPCTGSGVIRKDETRKWKTTSRDIQFLHRLQKELIASAANHLADDGILLYCTCSLEPEENELVINWAVKNTDLQARPLIPQEYPTINFNILQPPLKKINEKWLHKSVRHARRIFPTPERDGFFICKLQKRVK